MERTNERTNAVTSTVQKNENQLRFDKHTESLKVGNFLSHSVYTECEAKICTILFLQLVCQISFKFDKIWLTYNFKVYIIHV